MVKFSTILMVSLFYSGPWKYQPSHQSREKCLCAGGYTLKAFDRANLPWLRTACSAGLRSLGHTLHKPFAKVAGPLNPSTPLCR